jgi:anti-sigma factor RsiW
MRHPDEDALAACALGEVEQAEREAVLSHVASCKRCAAELESLRMLLAAAADLPVPHRDESYGRRVWARIEPRLPQRQPRAHRGIGSWRPWLAAAARRGRRVSRGPLVVRAAARAGREPRARDRAGSVHDP